MLSACAPCMGFWINPTVCSGQDQDPSDETIVGLDLTELLDETTKIPKDSEAGSLEAEKAEFTKLKQKNRKAATRSIATSGAGS